MSVMATPPSDESRKLFSLLVDRQWHRYLDVREAIAKSIPPGRALRRYQSESQQYARKANIKDPDYKGLKTDDEKIEIGKRQLAQVTITSWRRSGALLERGEKSGREIKVRGGWTSTVFPGYEPELEDLDSEPVGSPEVPPEDSVASEGRTPQAQADPEDVFAPAPPSPEPEPVAGQGDPEEVRRFVQDQGEWKPVERFETTRILPHAVSPEGAVFPVMGTENGCELCGLTVGNEARHRQWHAEENKGDTPSEMALLNESQLKDLIRKELVDILDGFQVGMQAYIDNQFAQLEGVIAAGLRMQMKWTAVDASARNQQ